MPIAVHQPWKWGIALFTIAVILTGTGNWILPLVDRDEPRFSEASREMIERDDWVVPHFNNEYRFDKPPLIYWCQATCFKAFGENEFAARLPSIVATGLTTVIIFLLGARMFGHREGWWAAIMFATSLQTLIHGRLAVADMLMVLLVTLAVWAGWELIHAERNSSSHRPGLTNRWWWIFWVGIAAGFLAKGPVALLPIVALVLFALWNKSRSPMSGVGWTLGILFCVGIVALWGIPALIRTHGEFARIGLGRHVIKRSVQPLEGHGFGGIAGYIATLPLYLATVFFSFFPWSCALPRLVREAWNSGTATSPEDRWLLSVIASVVVPFSLVATKLPHYILPAMPALAIIVSGWWFRSRREENRLRKIAWTTAVFALLIAIPGFFALSTFFPSPRLVELVKDWVRPNTEIASTAYDEPSLVWYFRRYTRGFHTPLPPSELRAFMNRPGPRLCVLPTKEVAESIGPTPADWHSARVSGLNLVHARRVDLTVLVHD